MKRFRSFLIWVLCTLALSAQAAVFNVTATVAGLQSGQAVVLVNNDANPVTVGQNGAVVVSTLSNGAAYKITVRSQPPQQNCGVANGSGNINNAGVSNITVNCVTARFKSLPAISLLLTGDTPVVAPSSYSISAAVSGLETGKTVVLQNSNNEQISYGSNGAKTFVNKLATGSSYAITVKTQPLDQYCAVSNGSGVVGNANVSNVTVACSNIVTGLRTLWISKSGNNNNSCLGQVGNACASIQKALSMAQPGDTIYIAAGTYIESSATSAYTSKCGFFDPQIASLCINVSGTIGAPITLQAAPGDAGKVILDGESTRLGIQMGEHDYIVIRGLTFKNNYLTSIVNYGQSENAVADTARLSIGVVIENNWFYNAIADENNSAFISMWSTRDWVVRNNLFHTGLHAIQSYGVINALVENNTFRNVMLGIFWKDHFVKDNVTRGFWDESEVRYNDIEVGEAGIQVAIRGTNSPEAGHNYFHHNLIKLTRDEAIGIRHAMAGAFAISGNLRVEHNLIDGKNLSGTTAVTVDTTSYTILKGNIFVQTKLPLELIKYDNEQIKIPHLNGSDYNLFVEGEGFVADRYSNPNTARGFPTLAEWKTALNADFVSLDFDHPDTHSKVSTVSAMFSSPNAGQFLYAANSPAKSMMADASNAGPYQTGSEVIGSNLSTSSAPTLYDISVSLTGLASGHYLSIQNSNTESLLFGSNSSKNFGLKQVTGNAYEITVSRQPTGQTCTVSNGKGVVGAANISVAIHCVGAG